MDKNFFQKVYDVVKLNPKGYVSTYGQIAKFIGQPTMSRQVGWALHKNPYPIEVPCHRVVFSDGSLSPAFAFGGLNRQFELLQNENVEFLENGKINMKKHLYKFV